MISITIILLFGCTLNIVFVIYNYIFSCFVSYFRYTRKGINTVQSCKEFPSGLVFPVWSVTNDERFEIAAGFTGWRHR